MTAGARRPVRSCLGCRTRRLQAELVRMRAQAGRAVLDQLGDPRLGRGAYCCARMGCLQAAGRRGALAKALRLPSAAVDVATLARGLAAVIQPPPAPPAPDVEDRASPS